MINPTADRVTAIYDAIDAFQRQHQTVNGLGHAQIRALLAEHLARVLPAAPAVQPPADRPAEEVAKHVTRAIFALKSPAPSWSKHYLSGWGDGLEAAMDAARDAILAVLPEPVDQAAVRVAALREGADELGRMDYDTDSNDYGYDTYRDAWNGGVMDGAALLRRLAGEQPTLAEARPTLRERHRAAWNTLTPDQQAARIAALDAEDEEPQP